MSQAVELQEASKEITMLRDLLTDLWNFQNGSHRHPLTHREMLLWARVEQVVNEGQYGWSGEDASLERRVARLERVMKAYTGQTLDA